MLTHLIFHLSGMDPPDMNLPGIGGEARLETGRVVLHSADTGIDKR